MIVNFWKSHRPFDSNIKKQLWVLKVSADTLATHPTPTSFAYEMVSDVMLCSEVFIVNFSIYYFYTYFSALSHTNTNVKKQDWHIMTLQSTTMQLSI